MTILMRHTPGLAACLFYNAAVGVSFSFLHVVVFSTFIYVVICVSLLAMCECMYVWGQV